MNESTSVVAWLGGILAIGLSLLRIWEFWSKRSRLDVTLLMGQQYHTVFTARDVKDWDYRMLSPKAGDPKEVFAVLEFTIANNRQRDITVGRINVAGWMLSDRYSHKPYDHARDYRVYELTSKERASLSDYRVIHNGEAIGFRVEIYEHPGNTRIRSRYPVELPDSYSIAIHTDAGRTIRKFKPQRAKLRNRSEFRTVFRWSKTELLPDLPIDSVAVPQEPSQP